MDEKLIIESVTKSAESLLAANGMELVDVQFRREGSGWVLRLFIDRPGGVTLNDCVFVSQQFGDILDVEDSIPVSYSLEVSSPGLDRPLKKPQDFERFKGRMAKIRISSPIDGRRNFKGVLIGGTRENIMIQVGGETIEIPFPHIEKAKLIPKV